MAYNPKYWRHPVGASMVGGHRIFSYVDPAFTIAQITAADFFQGLQPYVALNDWVCLGGSDGGGLARINALTATGIDLTDVASAGPGPWADPSDFATLELWYDAADAASVAVSGTSITAWNDKSANARDLVTASGTEPDYGTNTENGLNTVAFTLGDILDSTGSWAIPQPFNFAVLCALSTNFQRTVFASRTGGVLEVGKQNAALGTGKWEMAAPTSRALAADLYSANWTILSGTVDGATSYGGVNAVPVALAASPGANGLNGIRLGAGQTDTGGWTGQLAEFVAWSGAFDLQGHTDMLAYLQAKWAV